MSNDNKETLRECKVCKTVKHIREFDKATNGRLSRTCRDCMAKKGDGGEDQLTEATTVAEKDIRANAPAVSEPVTVDPPVEPDEGKVAGNALAKKERGMTVAEAKQLILDRNFAAHLPEEPEDEDYLRVAAMIPPEKKYRILIAEKEDGTEAAFVQVNGQPPYWMKRGVELVVPGRVVEAMKNAVEFRYISNAKENRIIATQKHAEMFQILGEVEETAQITGSTK